MPPPDGLPGLDHPPPFSPHPLSHVFLVLNGAGSPYIDHPPWMTSLESSLRTLSTNFSQCVRHTTSKPTALFLPLEWHSATFSTWQHAVQPAHPNRTHTGSGTVRDAVAETLGDVILVASPTWRRMIVKYVKGQVEALLNMVRRNRPNWNGKVSLMAHSIGGIIALELLQDIDIEITALILTGCPVIAYQVLAPEQQTSLAYLRHNLSNLRVVNVYHALDPVAFRLEPFLGIDEQYGVKVVPKRRGFWDDAGGFWDEVVDNLSAALFGGRGVVKVQRKKKEGDDTSLEGGVLVHGRIDYELQDGMGVPPLDVLASWGAVKAHAFYWKSTDVARILVDVVGGAETEGEQQAED